MPPSPLAEQTTPFDDGQASPAPPAPPTGNRYRVLRPHARGGLGEVFVAEDLELRREVALKEIQARHAHDGGSRGRFVAEAEITGRLEHPGIVPVYGLGAYPDGRPFYAMRFVRGDTLHDAAARFHAAGAAYDSVAFRQLLGRFVDVCEAVAYAHSRGVLHRDLKPSNVMLGKYGETLVVDWGLAKVVGRDDDHADEEGPLAPVSDGSRVETQAGVAMGTPAYMSPEQAAGLSNDLGPATDVYSLGGVLFYVLAGRPPLTGNTVAEVLIQAQAGRGAAATRTAAGVPAALAAVCARAMAVRAADRYPTAQALADDVNRWLADEPVAAFAEPAAARARRWVRKHPGPVAGVAAALVVGVVALGAGLVAVAAERGRTELARQGEARERAAAEASAADARERQAETAAVLTFVEERVFAAARPAGQRGGLGRDVTIRRAVEAALPTVATAFADRPLTAARLRATIGLSFVDLGDPAAAERMFQAARAVYVERFGPDHHGTLACDINLAVCAADRGRPADAVAQFEDVLRRCRAALGPDHLTSQRAAVGLATTYSDLGRPADAVPLLDDVWRSRRAALGPDHLETLGAATNLATAYDTAGRDADALALRVDTDRRSRAALGPDHPDTLSAASNLAISYNQAGRPAEALALHESTLKALRTVLGPDHPETIRCLNSIGNDYHDLGRHAEALAVRADALARSRTVLGPDHPDTLSAAGNLANSYFQLDRVADAIALRTETFSRLRATVGPDHPTTLLSANNLAADYVAAGRYADALSMIDDTLGRAVRRGSPDLLLVLARMRMHVCVTQADAAGCRATAERWEGLNRTDPDGLYFAASFRARVASVTRAADPSPAGVARAGEQAALAVRWLRRLVDLGYRDADHVAGDTNFDGIRERDDYRAVIAAMRAAKSE